MNNTRLPKALLYIVGVLACVGMGCKSDAPSAAGAPQISAVEAALTIFDCQTQAMQCLGGAPAPDKIMQCGTALQACMGDVQKQMQAQRQALASCGSDALQCGLAAKSASDAMQCRSQFQSCIGAAIMPTPGAGGAGGAGGSAAGSSAAGAGGESAATGGSSSAGSGGSTGTGGSSAGTGGSSAGTGGSSAGTGGQVSNGGRGGRGDVIGTLAACQMDGLACIAKAMSIEEARACDATFRMCIGLPMLPTAGIPTQPGLPGLPPFGGGAAGR